MNQVALLIVKSTRDEVTSGMKLKLPFALQFQNG